MDLKVLHVYFQSKKPIKFIKTSLLKRRKRPWKLRANFYCSSPCIKWRIAHTLKVLVGRGQSLSWTKCWPLEKPETGPSVTGLDSQQYKNASAILEDSFLVWLKNKNKNRFDSIKFLKHFLGTWWIQSTNDSTQWTNPNWKRIC